VDNDKLIDGTKARLIQKTTIKTVNALAWGSAATTWIDWAPLKTEHDQA